MKFFSAKQENIPLLKVLSEAFDSLTPLDNKKLKRKQQNNDVKRTICGYALLGVNDPDKSKTFVSTPNTCQKQ